MGKSSKVKGDAGEREFIRIMGGSRTFWQPENDGEAVRGDVINVPYLGRGEIKRRKDGFKQLYSWLADNDFLAVRSDRKKWLVIMPADDLKQLLDEMDQVKEDNLRIEGGKIN